MLSLSQSSRDSVILLQVIQKTFFMMLLLLCGGFSIIPKILTMITLYLENFKNNMENLNYKKISN